MRINTLQKNSITQPSAEYKELLDIIAGIIAFDILKKTEDTTEEETR